MEVKCKVRYASYSISSSNDAVFKDGHRMFMEDVVKDLNRKSYLENKLEQLQKENEELRTALSLFAEYIEVYGDQPFYEIPRVKIMAAKEVLDKNGVDAG